MGKTKEIAQEVRQETMTFDETLEQMQQELPLQEATPYDLLHEIDVTPNILKKGDLDYLPWPIVFECFNRLFGDDWDAEEIENEATGLNYFHDGRTAWVKTRIRVHGHWRECSLPVMDNRNNSITLDRITSRDVSDTLKRCLVKNAAYWGLGTNVYTKLAAIEIMTQAQAEQKRAEAEQKKAEAYREKLSKAIKDLQQCPSLDILEVIRNNYRDLWHDEAFISEGKNAKARLSA